MTPAEAWYVYGLMPAGVMPAERVLVLVEWEAVEGVTPDSRVEVLPLCWVRVLASRVKRHLFDTADPAHRTADPDWMGQRVAAYHAVNATAAMAGPFLPVTFGTVFSSLDLLEDWLTPHRVALESAFGRLGRRREWHLTLQADAVALDAWLDCHDPSIQALKQAAARAGAGTAFLMRRRLDKTREAARSVHLAAYANRVEGVLADAGKEVTELVRSGRLAWTLLLADAAVTRLERRLEPLVASDEAGLSLRLSGPWPAYGFARAALANTTTQAEALAIEAGRNAGMEALGRRPADMQPELTHG